MYLNKFLLVVWFKASFLETVLVPALLSWVYAVVLEIYAMVAPYGALRPAQTLRCAFLTGNKHGFKSTPWFWTGRKARGHKQLIEEPFN